jgi:small-conductance mechanosensitive channel/CRP-like cAMP-binding protein
MTGVVTRILSALTDPMALAGTFLLVGYLVTRLAFRDRPVGRFLCQLTSFAGFSAMLVVAGVMPAEPTPAMALTFTYVVISAFKIVWWIAAAWLLAGLTRAVLVFKRQPRETRFLQDLVAGFVYGGAALAIVAYVLDMPVSGLLAASGVVAIVVGLALQSTLGDVFSGIVLNLAKPYHPGDWVILDGGLQGRVVETNWQATEILTVGNDLAIVPNSIIAKAKLVNASRPGRAHGVTIVVRLEPSIMPSRCIATLETALLSCNRILPSPVPTVTARSLDAAALECEIQVFVSSIDLATDAQNEVIDLVYRHTKAAGIRLAPPAGSALALPPRGAPRDTKDLPRILLEHLPIFAPLSAEEREELVPRMKRRSVKAGEALLAEGSVAGALSILASGVLAAYQTHGGKEVEVLRLAPGDCFGQSGILTGDASTFTVKSLTRATVYEIEKSDIAPVLENRPAIAAELGQILARRETLGRARNHEADGGDAANHGYGARLADRVRELFGLH